MWFLWFCSSILLIIIFLYLVYLRGKSLQHTWDSIFTVVKQKKEKIDSLHNLGESDINTIGVEYHQGKYVEIRETGKIQKFKNVLKEAKIRKIKYAYIPERVKIKVRTSSNEVIYNAFVLPSESTDVFIELLPEYSKFVICLSGLKSWLNEEKSS
jgi:hypothetical protein